MKVLLVNPPIRDFYNSPLRRQPLGLLYLAGSLREAGHEVRLVDSGAGRRTRRAPIPSSLRDDIYSSDAWDASPFKLFGRYHHYGPSYETIEAEARAWRPDAIGLSALFNAYAEDALACADHLKRGAPDSILVLGGGYPTSNARRALEHPAVNYVVQGEGETAFAALLHALSRGDDPACLPGVCGRGGEISPFLNAPEFHRDLDSLPWPARDLLDPESYCFEGRRLTHILSSRGCPFRCAFCSAHLTTGGTFRARKPEAVVAEMLDCRDRFGFDAFDFEDDNLTADPGRAMELMQRIIKAFGEGALWLGAMNGLAARGMTEELLEQMRRAGFRSLNFSPLAGEGAARSAMDRPETFEAVRTVCSKAAAIGFKITVYLMVGYPGQSLDTVMDQAAAWAGEPVLLAPSVFYPAPGSRIQTSRFPALNEATPADWAQTRSSLFPRVSGGWRRSESRTVFWMIRLANFCRDAVPVGDLAGLRERCAPWLRRFDRAGEDRNGRMSIHASTPLEAAERGFASLAGTLLSKRPHGIRLIRRGTDGIDWEYAVYPLENMIDEDSFYLRHGIPGFAGVFDG